MPAACVFITNSLAFTPDYFLQSVSVSSITLFFFLYYSPVFLCILFLLQNTGHSRAFVACHSSWAAWQPLPPDPTTPPTGLVPVFHRLLHYLADSVSDLPDVQTPIRGLKRTERFTRLCGGAGSVPDPTNATFKPIPRSPTERRLPAYTYALP